ncbi:MAG: hypothetical protein J4G16_10125 [Acidobacteria bacterium]|nr:hypothetical protein [Acidobacteriota bacterium]
MSSPFTPPHDLWEVNRTLQLDEPLDGSNHPRSPAFTQGQIADILQERGQFDETLRIRTEEELPHAITQGRERPGASAHRGTQGENRMTASPIL